LRESIEGEIRGHINDSAVIVALKRIKERSKRIYEKKVQFRDASLEITTTSNLRIITIGKSQNLPKIMRRLYALPELDEGYVMNATHGNYQTTIIHSEKLRKKIRDMLINERIISEITHL